MRAIEEIAAELVAVEAESLKLAAEQEAIVVKRRELRKKMDELIIEKHQAAAMASVMAAVAPGAVVVSKVKAD